jgi:galactose mutarotase-like enzyme
MAEPRSIVTARLREPGLPTMDDVYTISSSALTARVKAAGAELTSLYDQENGELLWQAGPEWPRHAPILFPIVGRLSDDTLLHEGRRYRMTQHGFARDSLFRCIAHQPWQVVFALSETAETLASYPFRFGLELNYAVEGRSLAVTARVSNPGDRPLPFSIGAHPAFRWPLVEGAAKDTHRLVFERPEPGPVLSIAGGLLGPAVPSPVEDHTVRLMPGLFANDALVLPSVASRNVSFVADGEKGSRRSLRVAWSGYRDLGLWSKPTGADFLCIEPWSGTASPIDWQGEFASKPGIVALPPGDVREFVWSVTLGTEG